MEINKIKEVFEDWDKSLSPRQKKYIHFFSMRNFVFHFDDLLDERVKENAILLINNYMNEVQENYWDYGGARSYGLVTKYLNKLSKIYTTYLGFKTFLQLRFVIIFGIIGDGILYLFLRNVINFYLPVISLLLFSNYLYIQIFFVRRKKVFGIFY